MATGDGSDTENQGSYNEFINTIDTVILDIKHTIKLLTRIPLFHKYEKELSLKLISTRSYNGMTDLVYKRRL